MRKFKIQISNRVFCEDDLIKRSDKVGKEQKEILDELPAIRKHEKSKKEELWLIAEEKRKWSYLGCSPPEMADIQSRLWIAEKQINEPRKKLNERSATLLSEQEKLTNPIIADIVNLLIPIRTEILEMRESRIVGDQLYQVDRHDVVRDVKVKILESNLGVIDTAISLLTSFTAKVKSMTHNTISEILEEVKEFEGRLNSIDFIQTMKEEISDDRFSDLRESKLL